MHLLSISCISYHILHYSVADEQKLFSPSLISELVNMLPVIISDLSLDHEYLYCIVTILPSESIAIAVQSVYRDLVSVSLFSVVPVCYMTFCICLGLSVCICQLYLTLGVGMY